MLLNEPVVKLWLTLEPSVPPSPAVAPAAETTPASPPGILTVTLVFWVQPTAGGNTAPSEAPSEAWPPGAATVTTPPPAAKPSAAPPAVRAAPRLFGRVAPNDFQTVLVAKLSLPVSNDDCCLRNHPDPDTVSSPPRD